MRRELSPKQGSLLNSWHLGSGSEWKKRQASLVCKIYTEYYHWCLVLGIFSCLLIDCNGSGYKHLYLHHEITCDSLYCIFDEQFGLYILKDYLDVSMPSCLLFPPIVQLPSSNSCGYMLREKSGSLFHSPYESACLSSMATNRLKKI